MSERSERTNSTSKRTDSTSGTVRYLSRQWITELSREVADSEQLARLATDHSIGVTQVVTDGPEGTVTYHLEVRDGDARFAAGPAAREDVRMEQDWSTAVAIATGELNAQEAFISGRIRLTGNQQLLLESQPVFGALDAVFTTVRGRTDYS
ncbi:MAG TPA: SCP2 sterol-binding domain-containing protein [Ilumatobacteraceae bacterium]|nr:SCP2 sterol-binding domain-containing protein [Ilumatobacteraceae bacterium]